MLSKCSIHVIHVIHVIQSTGVCTLTLSQKGSSKYNRRRGTLERPCTCSSWCTFSVCMTELGCRRWGPTVVEGGLRVGRSGACSGCAGHVLVFSLDPTQPTQRSEWVAVLLAWVEVVWETGVRQRIQDRNTHTHPNLCFWLVCDRVYVNLSCAGMKSVHCWGPEGFQCLLPSKRGSHRCSLLQISNTKYPNPTFQEQACLYSNQFTQFVCFLFLSCKNRASFLVGFLAGQGWEAKVNSKGSCLWTKDRKLPWSTRLPLFLKACQPQPSRNWG